MSLILGMLKQLFGSKGAGASPAPAMARAGADLPALREAVARAPGDAGASWRLVGALTASEEYESARDEAERLVRLAPGLAEAHVNLGHVQRNLGSLREALESYRCALAIDPGHVEARSSLLLALNYSTEHSPGEIFSEHLAFGERCGPVPAAPAPDPAWPRRLRIGYVSPDFRSHVVTCFMLPALARHDRERFEIFCYYTYPEADSVTHFLRPLVEHWSDCAHLSDADLAARIRADRIDILVDLAGHMACQRLNVFAQRPAPVQATYLGYPNTTGLAAVDYRIGDAWVDPPGESDRYYTEHVARLGRSFLCYRPGPDIHEVVRLPASRAGRVTFGCFSNFQKLSDPFFATAARVLVAVPGSRLLLKARPLASHQVADAVRARFAAAGIGADRLVLRGWSPKAEDHLREYREVDIALDSFPYNGTTTTCEAMWMGAPVITLRGDRHAGRVGASLLTAVGLPGQVARDTDEYVRIAAGLAADLQKLADLRAGMRDRLRQSPLMDELGFTRELERCYEVMWQERLRSSA
jgi:protein O-GlcNAc transferase